MPFAVETCGYIGKEAIKFVNRLGNIAGESGPAVDAALVQSWLKPEAADSSIIQPQPPERHG